MTRPKCKKIPLPGEIYTVHSSSGLRLVKVISYKDISPDFTMEQLEYREWDFKALHLEYPSKPTIEVTIKAYHPDDACLIWSLLREPTEEDLKRRTVFDD